MDMRLVLSLPTGYVDIDEGTQAVVLAEVATRLFVARGAIVDVGDCFKTDECGGTTVVP
jgi:hypothetical protein